MKQSSGQAEVAERNETIDVLRGIGILLMVAGHIHFSTSFNHYIFSFHMPLFFVVSGYCYHRVGNFLDAIGNKAKKLIVPYLSFGLAYFLLQSFLSVIRGNGLPFKSLFSLLFHGTENLPLESALWFLPALFYAWILYTAILVATDRHPNIYIYIYA